MKKSSPGARLREINKRWKELGPLDPNFGYETPGASFTSVLANQMYGSVFTAPSDVATANSISFYGRTAVVPAFARGILVLHSTLGIVANGIGQEVSVSTTLTWYTSTFSTPPALSPNVEYVLMMIPSPSTRMYYNAGDTNQGHYDTSNDFANPTDPTDAVHNNNKYSIYCTYTSGAPPAAVRPVLIDGLVVF